MALPWDALVTVSDIERDNLGVPFAGAGDAADAIEQAILDMQGQVCTYLNRKPIVRLITETPTTGWTYSLFHKKYMSCLRHWPIVKVHQVLDIQGNDVTDSFEIAPESDENFDVMADNVYVGYQIQYWAGYIRRGEVLDDVQAYTAAHADLDVLPPVLPDDIRSCVTELVLNRLTLAKNQQFGVGQKVQGVAGSRLEFEKPDNYFSTSRLRSIKKYKRMW